MSISESGEEGNLLAVAEAPGGINKVNIVLLFAAAFLYDFAVGGAMEILGVFVLKEPLSWTAAQVTFTNFCLVSFYLLVFSHPFTVFCSLSSCRSVTGTQPAARSSSPASSVSSCFAAASATSGSS